jgi:hypothetical protein
MGSDVVILLFVLLPTGLPTSFNHARNFARQRQLAETDTTQPEFTQEPSRTPAAEAAITMPATQLRRFGRFGYGEPFISGDLGGSGHCVS